MNFIIEFFLCLSIMLSLVFIIAFFATLALNPTATPKEIFQHWKRTFNKEQEKP